MSISKLQMTAHFQSFCASLFCPFFADFLHIKENAEYQRVINFKVNIFVFL